jgi:hypothetical protein
MQDWYVVNAFPDIRQKFQQENIVKINSKLHLNTECNIT